MTKTKSDFNLQILEKTAELQRRASDPENSVFVSASAGSGKTKILTDRVLRLLLSGTSPSKILCLTFTKVAAAEMQNRVLAELEKWVYLSDKKLNERLKNLTGNAFSKTNLQETRTLFAMILDDPIGLQINTIHAFCQNLMRKFPVEAKISPNFKIIDKQTANELLIRAKNQLLQMALSDKNLAKKITAIAAKLNENSFSEIILELIKKREKLLVLKERHFDIKGVIDKIYQLLNYDPKDEKNIFAKYDLDFESLNLLVLELEKNKHKHQKIIADFIKNPDLEKFISYKEVFLTKENEPRKHSVPAKITNAAPFLNEIISKEQQKLIEFNEYLNSAEIAKSTANLLEVLDLMLKIYADLKLQNGYLDYDDLINKTGNLLQNSMNSEWIKYKLDGQTTHILIDESQDTNHYQWNIIKAITEDFFSGKSAINQKRTIFVVGDEKQSIYSFQGADPSIFSDIRNYYQAKLNAVNSELIDIYLDNSFRSYEAVLKAVDAVFAKSEYQKAICSTKYHAHNPIKDNYFGKMVLWPKIHVPEITKNQENPFEWQLNFEADEEYKSKELLAKIIAKTIKKWLKEKKLMRNNGFVRPVKCGDIMILVRNRTNNLGNLLIKYLQEEQVSVRGSDKINLEKHIITQDFLALIRFLLLKEDDLNLASLLKSPFLGISEEELLELCLEKNQRQISLFAVFSESQNPQISEKYQKLIDLKNYHQKNQFQLYELFAYMLEIQGGRQAIIARFGKEAEEIINQFLTLTINYQHENPVSLEKFADFLSKADLEVNIDFNDENADEVKITTIHGAKGLEAKIVILADCVHTPKNQFGQNKDRIIWSDSEYDYLPFWPCGKSNKIIQNIKRNQKNQEQDEYLRALYVAMTRAEEELYVTGFGEKEAENSWYNLIKNAILPFAKNAPFDFNQILDEKDSKEYLVLEGLVIENQEKLVLSETDFAEVNQAQIIIPEFINKNILSEKSPEIIYPSKLNPEDLPQKLVIDNKAHFGKIIHKILEIIPDFEIADKPSRNQVIEKYLSSNIHLSNADKNEIQRQVLNILDNKNFNFLFTKNSKSEVPIIGEINGQIISGKIDRLIIDENQIIIIDYKTGKISNSSYHQQLLLYKKLLGKIYPDKEIKCALILTDFGKIIWID